MLPSINKVIKVLILSYFLLVSAFGFVEPIFAIFITQQISGGSVMVVGFAVGIFWFVKSLIQIPVGRYLDKNHGEKDDFYFALLGTFLTALTPFAFAFSSLPWHIYLLQIIRAIGLAMLIPSWGGIFIRHADRGKEAMEWAAQSTVFGFGIGIAGALGGVLVGIFGFMALFIFIGALSLLGTLALLLIYNDMSKKDGRILRISPSKEEPL